MAARRHYDSDQIRVGFSSFHLTFFGVFFVVLIYDIYSVLKTSFSAIDRFDPDTKNLYITGLARFPAYGRLFFKLRNNEQIQC